MQPEAITDEFLENLEYCNGTGRLPWPDVFETKEAFLRAYHNAVELGDMFKKIAEVSDRGFWLND